MIKMTAIKLGRNQFCPWLLFQEPTPEFGEYHDYFNKKHTGQNRDFYGRWPKSNSNI